MGDDDDSVKPKGKKASPHLRRCRLPRQKTQQSFLHHGRARRARRGRRGLWRCHPFRLEEGAKKKKKSGANHSFSTFSFDASSFFWPHPAAHAAGPGSQCPQRRRLRAEGTATNVRRVAPKKSVPAPSPRRCPATPSTPRPCRPLRRGNLDNTISTRLPPASSSRKSSGPRPSRPSSSGTTSRSFPGSRAGSSG